MPRTHKADVHAAMERFNRTADTTYELDYASYYNGYRVVWDGYPPFGKKRRSGNQMIDVLEFARTVLQHEHEKRAGSFHD